MTRVAWRAKFNLWVIWTVQRVVIAADATNNNFDFGVLYTKADAITDIMWVAITANTKNKILDFDVLYTRADAITDIQWVAIMSVTLSASFIRKL